MAQVPSIRERRPLAIRRIRPSSDDKLIEELAGLEPLAYEKRRGGAAKELGVRATELDKFVRAKRKAVRRARAAPAAMPDLAASATPDQKAAASALMREADILEALGKAVESSGLVGEADNAKILYLALTSRLFERPVSIAIKGVSAGGKSYTVETVLKFFPNAAYFARTGMSEKALIYSEESFKHRFIIIYEAAGMKSDMMSYIIRSLLSEGRIDYELVDKTASDGLLPKHIVKEGPTGLITTTTQARLHPENETRLLSLSVVDTKEQTKAVMKSLAADRADSCRLCPVASPADAARRGRAPRRGAVRRPTGGPYPARRGAPATGFQAAADPRPRSRAAPSRDPRPRRPRAHHRNRDRLRGGEELGVEVVLGGRRRDGFGHHTGDC